MPLSNSWASVLAKRQTDTQVKPLHVEFVRMGPEDFRPKGILSSPGACPCTACRGFVWYKRCTGAATHAHTCMNSHRHRQCHTRTHGHPAFGGITAHSGENQVPSPGLESSKNPVARKRCCHALDSPVSLTFCVNSRRARVGGIHHTRLCMYCCACVPMCVT